MDIASLIGALSSPGAYPYPVTSVDVKQTHISAVFLAGDYAYKIKKPVKLSFLDFSTLDQRRHFCDEEVRLNRRLAPDVYLGVVPVVHDGARIRFEGPGEAIEWAVKMRRLPEAATLEEYVKRDEIDAAHVRTLAARLAAFHATCARSEHIVSFGRFDGVAGNIRENFTVAAPMIGRTIDPTVRTRLIALTEQALADLRPIIDARAARGIPCDTHGDLHLDHVYLFPEKPAPGDLVVVDCIEFNERFRYTDPIADMAFLAMDLKFHGRRDLAAAFAEAYFQAVCGVTTDVLPLALGEGRGEGCALLPNSPHPNPLPGGEGTGGLTLASVPTSDPELEKLLSLYTSYRAAVRGKVDGLLLAEPEIPEAAKADALLRARGHWLLALSELETPRQCPCLVLVGGLPGTGKSTLAANLAEHANFQVIRSDVVRKELAGLPGEVAVAERDEIYTPEWTDRTYAECLRRAEQLLFEGGRVIVDATFIEETRRRQFFDAALRWSVPAQFLVCEADPAAVKTRLAARHGDASDADWAVYLQLAQRWEEPGAQTKRCSTKIEAGESAKRAFERAQHALADAGLT